MKKRNEPIVYAERNGRKRGFYLSHWNMLPSNKYGWNEIKSGSTIPAPVAEAMDKAKPEPAPAEPEQVATDVATDPEEKPKRKPRKK